MPGAWKLVPQSKQPCRNPLPRTAVACRDSTASSACCAFPADALCQSAAQAPVRCHDTLALRCQGKLLLTTVPMVKAWKDGGLAKPAAPPQSCKPVHTHRCEGLGFFSRCRRGATPKRADGPRGSARSTLKFRLSSKTKRLRELLFCCRHRLSTFLSGDNHARHCLASWSTHHCHSAAHAFWGFLSSFFSMHGCALWAQWPVQQIYSVLQAFFLDAGYFCIRKCQIEIQPIQSSPAQSNEINNAKTI